MAKKSGKIIIIHLQREGIDSDVSYVQTYLTYQLPGLVSPEWLGVIKRPKKKTADPSTKPMALRTKELNATVITTARRWCREREG